MITRASEFGSYALSWIVLTVGTPVRRGSSHVRSGWGAVFHRLTLLWKERVRSRVRHCAWPCWPMRWLWMSRGGSWSDITTVSLCSAIPWLFWSDEAAKNGGLDGCLLPITFPMTVGLGESTAGALNALVPVPASGGGWRPCAQGLSIRTSHFRIRRSLSGRASIDLRDPCSVFEAMVGTTFW